MPKGLYQIYFGEDQYLDPVGYARLHNYNPIYFVFQHPIHAKLKAEATPLEKTILPEIIKDNIKRLEIPLTKKYKIKPPEILPDKKNGKSR